MSPRISEPHELRRPTGDAWWPAVAIATAAAGFHLFAAGIAPFTALVQRPVHFALMAMLGFIGFSAGWAGGQSTSSLGVVGGVSLAAFRRRARRITSLILSAGAVWSAVYLVVQHESLVQRSGAATPFDLVSGAIAIVVVLVLAARATGWGLVTVAGLAVGYALAGPYLPGILAHRGYSIRRIIEHLYLGTEGIWGVPLGVSADFVYLFILFGATLEVAGGGQLLISLAAKVAGNSRGGPAKTAVIASAIMGSLSGSAVANVATTGSLTIPLMKRTGFKPHFAAAIEAAASTGGQLMPPVMGAGAFIMATWTNIPYGRVATAAVIPAVLYYLALFSAIDFRSNQRRLARSTLDVGHGVARRLHLLAPLGVIVVMLALGRSPMRAAFWGVISALAATAITRATRLDRSQLAEVVVSAARGTVQVAAACAAAGIVVGAASLTGIGLRMSELIVSVSGGYLPVALGLTALGSIVLGMGLPTTAAYVVLAALGAPALRELGVPTLAAHLFIFYYGCLSNVTPPVALAAYAGAGIARSRPLPTAFTAMVIAGAGFVVPFVFVYRPPLLLVGSWMEVVTAFAITAVGLVALAGAVIGFVRGSLSLWQRAVLAAAGIAVLIPGFPSGIVGGAVILLIALRTEPRDGVEEAT